MNLYANLAELKAALAKSVGATGDDAELLRLAGAMSRAVDDWTHRRFYSEQGTRYYDGHASTELWLRDDLLEVTALDVDVDGDGVYETALTSGNDYWLWPDNQLPKKRIDLNHRSGVLGRFPAARRAVAVTGTFGYGADTQHAGVLNDEGGGLTAGETSATLAAGHAVAAGDTLVIETEQVYVAGVTGNDLSIVRAINGTSAADHANGVAVYRRTYPAPVAQAVVMQVARMWNEQRTGYSGGVGSPELGGFGFSSLYPAIRDMLSPYVMPVV